MYAGALHPLCFCLEEVWICEFSMSGVLTWVRLIYGRFFLAEFFFFFSSRRRHTRLQGDWSSDVCSSDLHVGRAQDGATTAGQDAGTISGAVTAQETGAPLAEARVTIVGTALGATAGVDGRYTIALVPPGTYRLRAQLIGHAPAELAGVVVAAGNTATADFRLPLLAISLSEVVVVGYGTQARKDVTGSVTSVSGGDVTAVPKANAVDALKGRVPGVDILTTGNKPGDGISIRVRGERSLTASNDPLYVLDGIPMSGGIGDLNPNDIESIEVLKDASATAIYGSRGASGVVLITTRQGKAGGTSVSYDTYFGVQQASRRMQMMNGPQFAPFKREASPAGGKDPW